MNNSKIFKFWSWTMKFFRWSCHQDPIKSFFIGKYQMPMCARCFGIYIGLIIGIIVGIIFYQQLNFVIGLILLQLMLFDWINQNMLKLYFSNIIRFITGMCGGSGLILLFTSFISILI